MSPFAHELVVTNESHDTWVMPWMRSVTNHTGIVTDESLCTWIGCHEWVTYTWVMPWMKCVTNESSHIGIVTNESYRTWIGCHEWVISRMRHAMDEMCHEWVESQRDCQELYMRGSTHTNESSHEGIVTNYTREYECVVVHTRMSRVI